MAYANNIFSLLASRCMYL